MVSTYYGLWWFPDKQEEKFHAQLIVEEEKATLLTLGQLSNGEFGPLRTKLESIHGLATDINERTDYSFKLYNLFESSRLISALNKFTWTTNLYLMGKPSASKTSMQFSAIMLTSYPWKFWLRKNGFNSDFSRLNDTDFDYSFQYSKPKSIDLFENEVLKIEIFFRASFSHTAEEYILLREDPILNIDFSSEKDLKEVFKYRQLIERFFMILWEEPHLFSSSEVLSTDKSIFEIHDGRQEVGIRTHSAMKFDEYIENSSTWFSSWVKVSEKYDYPIMTFFFALTGYRMDIHSKFLNFIFALEQFHMICIRDLEPLSKKNEKMYNKALAEIKSGDAKSWFLSVLRRGSNIRLSKRLEELINHLPVEDQSTYHSLDLERIEKTRHYLVHLDEKYRSDVIPPSNIVEVNDKLIKLMFRLLKQEIGC